MFNRIKSGIYWTVKRGLASRISYNLWRLKKLQLMKKQDFERIQVKRLRMMIKYAYNYVPYYHQLFNSAKIRPKDIKCKSDLQKVPFTNKEDVQRKISRIIARGIDWSSCRVKYTTGSTGKPLKIFYDDRVDDYSTALWRYTLLECGLHLRDTFVNICHCKKSNEKPRFSFRLLMKGANVSLYNPANKIMEILEKIRPDALYTFPSILTILAEHLTEKNSKIRPKLIFSIGETVTQQHRKLFQKTFDINTNDIYGCAEFGYLAFECNEHTGLHMIPDCCVLEFLKEGEAVNFGEEGEIVITGLFNYVMPLIRYRIGDVGVTSEEHCSCGRSFPLIKRIVGRTDDFLLLPSGTVISPRNINLLENIPGIFQYQTVQEKRDRFVVKMVKGKGFGEDSINQIKEVIKAGCLGEDVTVDVEIVDNIPKERTGKIRTILSKVNQPQIIY